MSTKKEYQRRYDEVISWWNEKFGTRYRAIPTNLPNFSYWADIYSNIEIKTAILICRKHHFWKDKMTPTILFRKRSPRSEPVDYVGNLLNYMTDDPQVNRYKKALEEKEKEQK